MKLRALFTCRACLCHPAPCFLAAKFRDALLESSRDFLRVRARWKFHGFADVDSDAAGPVELTPRFADFVPAIDAHRHNGKFQIAREQADARVERLQFPVRR